MSRLRVIQLAQQLASGRCAPHSLYASNVHSFKTYASQQRLQLQQPPPAPLVPQNPHSIHPQPAVASNVANTRTVPVVCPFACDMPKISLFT